MVLKTEQLTSYREKGFLVLPGSFSTTEVSLLKAELPRLLAEDSPTRVAERSGTAVRSIYGTHLRNDLFQRLARHPRIVGPAMQILDSQVYVYQFKINTKVAFEGDVWQWHQDYIFWQKEDGLPSPRATTAVVFLDEITEFNGPLYLIPGSHKEGVIDVGARDGIKSSSSEKALYYGNSPEWISDLTADLRYALSRETIARLANRYGISAPKGPAGTVMLFDCNLVHGSSNNISPFDRALALVSFNSIENIPRLPSNARPDFLVSRDCEPIVPLSDAALHSN